MRAILAISLCVMLMPTWVTAGDKDDRPKWREKRQEEYWKQQEKAREQWFKEQEKAREHRHKHWERERDWREKWHEPDYRSAPAPYPDYGYRPSPRYPGSYDRYSRPYRHHHDDDDIDAIYTPFGYYEDYPKTPYEARRPRPEGHGQIGPFRFEIWK